MAEPVIFPLKPGPVRVLLAIWIVLTLVGATLLWLAMSAAAPDPVLYWAGLVGGSAIAATGVSLALGSWRTLRVDGPVIELGDAGFLDRRLAVAPLPWRDVEWKLVRRGRTQAASLHFSVSGDAGKRMSRAPDIVLNAAVNRFFGHPPFVVSTAGTGMSAFAIADFMAEFKPPQI